MGPLLLSLVALGASTDGKPHYLEGVVIGKEGYTAISVKMRTTAMVGCRRPYLAENSEAIYDPPYFRGVQVPRERCYAKGGRLRVHYINDDGYRVDFIEILEDPDEADRFAGIQEQWVAGAVGRPTLVDSAPLKKLGSGRFREREAAAAKVRADLDFCVLQRGILFGDPHLKNLCSVLRDRTLADARERAFKEGIAP